MKSRTFNLTLALWMTAALVFSSCDDSTGPELGSGGEPIEEFPTTFPNIPRPTSPDEVIADESEVYTAIAPLAGRNLDFAPTWTAGIFSWNVDIQTQYERCILSCNWIGDAPGLYYEGTAHNSELLFEGGVVDLRSAPPVALPNSPRPHPRRVLFVEDGIVLATPRNPEIGYAHYRFLSDYGDKRFDPALFCGYVMVDVEPGFSETRRIRSYYVVAKSCPQVTKPVFIKRERYWKRLPLGGDGNNLKSIRVDPGSTFEVAYTRTQGTSYTESQSLTRTLSGEVSVADPSEVVGAKLGGSLSEAFGSSVEITDETSVTVTRTMTGMDGKTVVYSVWTSVERYSIVDEDGNPYTDPSFTFDDLGNAVIQGEYEWISSTAFDYR
jgi:hypothetical protein